MTHLLIYGMSVEVRVIRNRVQCRKCGASIGESCISRNGNPVTTVHVARIEDFKAVQP